MALKGSERKVLHAILHEQREEAAGYVADTLIAGATRLTIDEVRDCLESLEGKGFVEQSVGVDGRSAYITAKGRQELRRTPVVSGDERAESQIKIVPKGLRSFDAEDKDFFLELLPGPRRRDGLPESIHFWKVRIEETDPDKTFKVGVIFGPSGCGKSSLVKAGLLPRLSGNIIAVYTESTEDETETRLMKGLSKHLPDVPAHFDLREYMDTLLARSGDSPKKKVLIVLDQFEQWLHARRSEGEIWCAGARRMRWRASPSPRHDSGRFLDGPDPVHGHGWRRVTSVAELRCRRSLRRAARQEGSHGVR